MPFYIIVYSNQMPIGICYFQLKKLILSQALKLQKSNSISYFGKQWLVNRINFYSLVCGNAMVTGNYGFRFKESLTKSASFDAMVHAGNHLILFLKKEMQINVGPFLLKDFYQKEIYDAGNLEKFTQFSVQPSMIFTINANWKTFDDYLGAMKAKYRTRVNRAFKKLGDLTSRSMSIDEMESYDDRMEELYNYVVDQASFNLFHLKKDYFRTLKNSLGNDLDVVGYFQGDQLVGFYTVIYNKEHLDAHFLGYDKSINHSHQLYLNMLYDMIRRGIDSNMKKIFMSRTALEIKSSTGAEAKDMFCYLKHTNSLYNFFLGNILNTLVPQEEWQPRSPFK